MFDDDFLPYEIPSYRFSNGKYSPSLGHKAHYEKLAHSLDAPAAANIAPQTPPPASKRLLAALTMTSVSMRAMSLRTIENGMGGTPEGLSSRHLGKTPQGLLW